MGLKGFDGYGRCGMRVGYERNTVIFRSSDNWQQYLQSEVSVFCGLRSCIRLT